MEARGVVVGAGLATFAASLLALGFLASNAEACMARLVEASAYATSFPEGLPPSLVPACERWTRPYAVLFASAFTGAWSAALAWAWPRLRLRSP